VLQPQTLPHQESFKVEAKQQANHQVREWQNSGSVQLNCAPWWSALPGKSRILICQPFRRQLIKR